MSSEEDNDDGYRVNAFKGKSSLDDDSSDDGKNNSDSDDDILYRRKKTQSKIFSLLIVYLFSFYVSFQAIFHDVTSLNREWWTRAAGCGEGCITAS